MKRSNLPSIDLRVPTLDTRAAKPAPKEVESFYQSREFRVWRGIVIERADRRCQWVENGFRCQKAEPDHRMFADHIEERRDGGAPFDPANGMCLCGRHHTLKTVRARQKRMQA